MGIWGNVEPWIKYPHIIEVHFKNLVRDNVEQRQLYKVTNGIKDQLQLLLNSAHGYHPVLQMEIIHKWR